MGKRLRSSRPNMVVDWTVTLLSKTHTYVSSPPIADRMSVSVDDLIKPVAGGFDLKFAVVNKENPEVAITPYASDRRDVIATLSLLSQR